MNRISGIVTDVVTCGCISQVAVTAAEGLILHTVVFDTLQTSPCVCLGALVDLCFKESDLVVMKECGRFVAASNRIPGTVIAIRRGEVLAELTFTLSGGQLTALLPVSVLTSTGLTVGDGIIALINATHISLAAAAQRACLP